MAYVGEIKKLTGEWEDGGEEERETITNKQMKWRRKVEKETEEAREKDQEALISINVHSLLTAPTSHIAHGDMSTSLTHKEKDKSVLVQTHVPHTRVRTYI